MKLLVILFSLSLLTFAGCGKDKEVESLRTQVETLQNQNNSLITENSDLKKQISAQSDSENSLNELSEKLSKSESALADAQSKTSTLEASLRESQSKVEELQQQLSSSSDQSFLSIKFWSDGYTYSANTENFTFYSDCFCSDAIGSNITLTSKITDEVKLSNGLRVYAFMSENGLVWSTKIPNLTKNK